MNTQNEERISKQQLMKMYRVDRTTIESWVKERGLPIIEISSHKKYVRREDLIDFENRLMKNKTEL